MSDYLSPDWHFSPEAFNQEFVHLFDLLNRMRRRLWSIQTSKTFNVNMFIHNSMQKRVVRLGWTAFTNFVHSEEGRRAIMELDRQNDRHLDIVRLEDPVKASEVRYSSDANNRLPGIFCSHLGERANGAMPFDFSTPTPKPKPLPTFTTDLPLDLSVTTTQQPSKSSSRNYPLNPRDIFSIDNRGRGNGTRTASTQPAWTRDLYQQQLEHDKAFLRQKQIEYQQQQQQYEQRLMAQRASEQDQIRFLGSITSTSQSHDVHQDEQPPRRVATMTSRGQMRISEVKQPGEQLRRAQEMQPGDMMQLVDERQLGVPEHMEINRQLGEQEHMEGQRQPGDVDHMEDQELPGEPDMMEEDEQQGDQAFMDGNTFDNQFIHDDQQPGCSQDSPIEYKYVAPTGSQATASSPNYLVDTSDDEDPSFKLGRASFPSPPVTHRGGLRRGNLKLKLKRCQPARDQSAPSLRISKRNRKPTKYLVAEESI